MQWDKQWVARDDAEVRYWSGDSCELFGGCTVYRCASTCFCLTGSSDHGTQELQTDPR